MHGIRTIGTERDARDVHDEVRRVRLELVAGYRRNRAKVTENDIVRRPSTAELKHRASLVASMVVLSEHGATAHGGGPLLTPDEIARIDEARRVGRERHREDSRARSPRR